MLCWQGYGDANLIAKWKKVRCWFSFALSFAAVLFLPVIVSLLSMVNPLLLSGLLRTGCVCVREAVLGRGGASHRLTLLSLVDVPLPNSPATSACAACAASSPRTTASARRASAACPPTRWRRGGTWSACTAAAEGAPAGTRAKPSQRPAPQHPPGQGDPARVRVVEGVEVGRLPLQGRGRGRRRTCRSLDPCCCLRLSVTCVCAFLLNS